VEKKRKKLGPVKAEERRNYLARLPADHKLGVPTEKTARLAWAQLEDGLPVTLDAFIPKSKSKTWPSPGPEYDRAALVARQSLVVTLDCALAIGERGAMLTKNSIFDALATRWSLRFRRAIRKSGVRTAYDATIRTVEIAERQLLRVVRFDTLWRVVAGRWSQKAGANPLFSVRRAYDKKGRPLGWRVKVTDSLALRTFEDTIKGDGQYHRPGKRGLLLVPDLEPRPRSVRQRVCAEQPCNVVKLGERSERVLSILERTWVRFDVHVFRDDYETLKEYLDGGHRPSTSAQYRGYRKLEAFVARWRSIYRQTDDIPVEAFEFQSDPDCPPEIDPDCPPEMGTVPRELGIRSRFFRAVNRRYHASNFWPEHVPKEFRERWFRTDVYIPDQDLGHPGDGPDGPYEPDERLIIPAHTRPGRYVERDIVASQIQTLAVFLGLEELETLATSKNPKLKEWLAERIWTQHQTTPGGVLEDRFTDRYTSEKDERLVAFAKKHLMRFYGADLDKLIRDCAADPDEYGPGWKTTRGVRTKAWIKPGTESVRLARSGAAEATERAIAFLTTLPPWIDDLEIFLEACRTLAKVTKDCGVVFRDPLDQAEVRWHHAQRGTRRVGHNQIEVRPFGKDTPKGFVPLPPGTVDRAKLARFLAPDFTQMLDAFFSSLVLEGLYAAHVPNVIALHDAWQVPDTYSGHPEPDSPGQAAISGSAVLERVIEEVGKEWLLGLEDIYDRLIGYLGNDLTFGPFVHGIKARWRERVVAGRWPCFLAG
jgi:hypothetical protein